MLCFHSTTAGMNGAQWQLELETCLNFMTIKTEGKKLKVGEIRYFLTFFITISNGNVIKKVSDTFL